MENNSQIFLKSCVDTVKKEKICSDIKSIVENKSTAKSDDFEIYLFANYDICNFTKYKKENKDWILLLQKFIYLFVSEFSMTFWKFNGDAITYSKKIQSIDEICKGIKEANEQLNRFQEALNEANSKKKIYIKASIWIAGFPTQDKSSSNNMKFTNHLLGQEFVGENIDEGFRLASCSKADHLVVDPKIVYILNYYDKKLKKENNMLELISDIHDTVSALYLMEFCKCKGVWDERDYPLFWYIKDINSKKLIYDETVGKQKLRDHILYKLSFSNTTKRDKKNINKTFAQQRDSLVSIFSQIEIEETINDLIEHLEMWPTKASSGKNIYDKANLYYTIACKIEPEEGQTGILIFKRNKNRCHLKNVWDFISIKHSRIHTLNLCEYLEKMLCQKLNIDHNICTLSIEKDTIRQSVKPVSLCNIYRNGYIHNGILCTAKISLKKDISVSAFLNKLKMQSIFSESYSDVMFVTKEHIKQDLSNSMFDWYIKKEKTMIRALTPEEVKNDSNNVAYDINSENSFKKEGLETDFGISYLAYSIAQILEE